MDLEGLGARLREIAAKRELDVAEAEAVHEFQKGMELLRNGRDPDDPFARIGL
jgi:hypothetical protein